MGNCCKDGNAPQEKKGFWARLFQKIDKKMEEKSKQGSCCCSGKPVEEKKDSRCCS